MTRRLASTLRRIVADLRQALHEPWPPPDLPAIRDYPVRRRR
jgi:hypothetical protein